MILALVMGSVLVCGGLHALGHRVGVNLADEGYVWYGAQRVLAHEVPIRDFRAYDPGRYWWYAVWLRWGRNSLGGLRLATSAFGAVGVLVGAVVVARASAGWLLPAVTVAVLSLWPRPSAAEFEGTWMAVGVLGLAAFVASPDALHSAAVGTVIALSATFGLNIALYLGVAAAIVAVGTLSLPGDVDAAGLVLALAGGGAVGSIPLLLLGLRCRGFAAAYWQRKVRRVVRRRRTNLAVPVPWPWRPTRPVHATTTAVLGRAAVRATLPAVAAVPAVVLVAAAVRGGSWIGGHPELFAAAAVALPAAHGILSRADEPHLRKWLLPMLLVALVGAAGGAVPAALGGAFVVATTGAIALPGHPAIRRIVERRTLEQGELGGTRLWLPPHERNELAVLRHEVRQGRFVALPLLVGLHADSDQASPVYDTFCVYPASGGDEETMIAELRAGRPEVVVIDDRPVDGRDDRRFSHTHPRTWAHLEEHYHFRSIDGIRGDLRFGVRRPG